MKREGANIIICWNGEISVLVSYTTPVAAKGPALLVRTDKRWSNTTERHINKWLGEEKDLAVRVPQERIQEIYNTL